MPAAPATYEAARREEILAAARERFQREGFHRTTMQDVAAEAGLSAGTLYLYFDGKEELIRTLAASGRDAEEALLAPLDDADDPVGALEAVLLGFLDAYRDDGAMKAGRLLVRYWGEALGSDALREELRDRRDGHVERVAPVVREAQSRGWIDATLPPASVARLLLGLVTTALLERSLDPDFDLDGYAGAVGSLLEGRLLSREEER